MESPHKPQKPTCVCVCVCVCVFWCWNTCQLFPGEWMEYIYASVCMCGLVSTYCVCLLVPAGEESSVCVCVCVSVCVCVCVWFKKREGLTA